MASVGCRSAIVRCLSQWRRGLRLARLAPIGALALAACGVRERTYVYPSPDEKASLLLEASIGDGPTGDVIVTAYLSGKNYETNQWMGDFDQWPYGSIKWIDNTTINICSFVHYPDTKKEYDILISGAKGDEIRKYHLVTNCGPEASREKPQPPGPMDRQALRAKKETEAALAEQ